MGWWTDLITLCLTCYWRWLSGMRRTGTAVCHWSYLPIAAAHRPLPESPRFTSFYGRDLRLPTEPILCPPPSVVLQNDADYVTEIKENVTGLGFWQETPSRRPRCSRSISMMLMPVQLRWWKVNERVSVYMPAAKSGTAYKLARPCHGQYCVVRE